MSARENARENARGNGSATHNDDPCGVGSQTHHLAIIRFGFANLQVEFAEITSDYTGFVERVEHEAMIQMICDDMIYSLNQLKRQATRLRGQPMTVEEQDELHARLRLDATRLD